MQTTLIGPIRVTMPQHDDEGPVYYREIQKNSYLKRVPTESGCKLKPLGHKKPQLKPMWTVLCVHNGRTPYLEQYAAATSACAARHAPPWRMCLRDARHVTAGVTRAGGEHDFVVQTDAGVVRMRAPDWESMRSWVVTLRSRLQALQVLGAGENLYQQPSRAPGPPPATPAAPAGPRAGTRDPTSPLPPTPSAVPDRVPGVELVTPATRVQPIAETIEPAPEPEPEPEAAPCDTIDISDWDTASLNLAPLPSTSAHQIEPKSVAKICGQNICLDDSILKRRDDSDGASSCGTTDDVETVDQDVSEDNSDSFKQRVVVKNCGAEVDESPSLPLDGVVDTSVTSNVTVIQVSNKPPHTAVPVPGPEANVFNFDVKPETADETIDKYINIVNTEDDARNNENGYGTVFSHTDSQYGHISLTTTVSLTAPDVKLTEDLYERLCMASTSNEAPASLQNLKLTEKSRKSSLPNLDSEQNSPYEYLYPSSNVNVASNNNPSVNAVNFNTGNTAPNVIQINHRTEVNSNGITDESLPSASNTVMNSRHVLQNSRTNIRLARNPVTVDANLIPNRSGLRTNVERSHSQNASDNQRRDRINQRQNSPKREANKNVKTEQPTQAKPIWKRGLTEFSLLSRFKGMGHKRPDSPTRQETNNDRQATSPLKVLRRSRPESGADSSRRRSNSLSNGESFIAPGTVETVRLPPHQAVCPPLLMQHDNQVWIADWGRTGARRAGGRGGRGGRGDRLLSLQGRVPRGLAHANQLIHYNQGCQLDIVFHRAPLGKLFILKKEREDESIGIKVDIECIITSIEGSSPAARAGLPPPGLWGVAEINNKPINLVKGGQKEINKLSSSGREVIVLLQPASLVRKLRAALKANKAYISFS